MRCRYRAGRSAQDNGYSIKAMRYSILKRKSPGSLGWAINIRMFLVNSAHSLQHMLHLLV